MFIRVCGGRKKSEKFVSTKGTISVTANVSGASVKITTAGAVSSIAEFKMDDLENKAKSAKLQPGEYIVEVSKKGYDTYKETVNVNGDITVNATLTESVKTGAAATVANSLLEYKNTVLVNDNAIVTVVVKDKEGNVVPGKTVVFSATNHKPSDANDPKKALEVKGNNVQTTDANGRVSFVVGFKNPTKESTDGDKVTSADYTAKVLDVTDGTESIASGSVGFAALNLEGVYVDSTTKLECGENAKNAGATSTSKTYSLNEDEKSNVTYVSTQKVSSNGNNEHEVTFNAKPQIVLPAMASEDKKAEEFVQPVNYKSGDYFTYADSKYDKIIPLEEEASQLKYATLMFNDIKISKHTRLVIDSYTDKECKNIISSAHKEIDGEHSQTGFGYQLPLNYNVKAVKVSIESAGQVQTDMNTGFDIDKIVGVYKNDNSTTGGAQPISSATVKWENVNPTMSDFVKLDASKVDDKNLLESLGIATDNNKKFDYQVPVFPYTGDAVIREFDANDKIVNYYLAPTVKVISGANHNTNVIASGAKAYKATEEEATNHMVGSIKADGVKVKVNSTAVGSTNVKGTISLPSLGGDALDAANKYIYTSVQWNPIPKDAAVSTSDAFLALSGQNINVYAQLVDKNGNPVSLKDQKITYSYRKEVKNDSSETVKNGAMVELKSADSEVKSLNKDIAVVNNTNTDVNGKATLTLNSAQANVLDDLKAESENYDVILYIGKEKASTADLYWVNPDLAFKKDVDSDYEVTDNGEKTVDSNKSNASTPWQYAVKAVGNKFISTDNTTDKTANAKRFEYPGTLKNANIDINGLNINTTFNEDNKGTYKVTGNGVVDGTSDREYKDIITNEFNGKFVGTDITFKVKDKTYSCVGEGTPNFNAKMNLNVTWEAKGTKLAITSPLGSTVSGNSAADNKGEAELYVKVTDATGNNPKSGETVTFKSGTESDRFVEYKLDTPGYAGQDSADNTVTAVTDGNGVARVKVKVGNVTEQKSSVITASVKDADQVATTTINWVKYEKAFGLVNAGVPADNEKQIKLTFNNNIEADSLKKDMFEVKNTHTGDPNENKKYEITSVTSSGRYVYLTLKSALPAAEYTVSIKPQTIDSVEYTLCDTKGVKLPASVEKEFYSENIASFNVSDATYGKIGAPNYDVATIKVDGIKCGIATKVGNSSDAGSAKVAGKKDAEVEFKNRFVVAVDGKIQTIALKNQDTSGNTIADLKVGENVLVEETKELTAGTETIEDASFTIQLKQANKDQKVEIFYLGGTGSKTVKVADDLQYTNYVWDAVKTKIDIEFNRNIDYNTVGGTKYNATTALGLITVDGKALSAADIVGNGQTAPTVDVTANKLTITLNDLNLTATSVIGINKNLFTDGYDYKNDVETITGLDKTAPTVVADKTTKVPAAAGTVSTNATYKFKFSEALDEASKTTLEGKVTSALTTTSTSTLTTNWNDVGDTLTITFTKGDQNLTVAQLNSGSAISVTDIHGNKGDIAVADLQES